MPLLINPRRACAARVTVVVLCVCVCVCVSVCQCVQASHPLLTQLQDQVDTYLWTQYRARSRMNFGVFRIMAEDSYSSTVSAIFIRETDSFSAFLPYTTLVISRVR